ncbi:hypothetical protein Dxin01_00213 [Deinococcus xinjiangensis]|uniref:Uncharacterized protein n=1 Tax=Deinococcus xinjiangensis TaxID=457454 RepID=A0ABP9V5D8_9DEIO
MTRKFRIDNPMHHYDSKYLNEALFLDESRTDEQYGLISLVRFDDLGKYPMGPRVLIVDRMECVEVTERASDMPDGTFTCRISNGCVEFELPGQPSRPTFQETPSDAEVLTLKQIEDSGDELEDEEVYWATDSHESDMLTYIYKKPIWATRAVVECPPKTGR